MVCFGAELPLASVRTAGAGRDSLVTSEESRRRRNEHILLLIAFRMRSQL
jgi:hypothetical protein